MVNTDALVDDTNKVDSIPQSEWRKEENLRLEKDKLVRQLKEKEITEKEEVKSNEWVKKNIAEYDLSLKKQMEMQTERIEAKQKAQKEVMREQLIKKNGNFFNFKKSSVSGFWKLGIRLNFLWQWFLIKFWNSPSWLYKLAVSLPVPFGKTILVTLIPTLSKLPKLPSISS